MAEVAAGRRRDEIAGTAIPVRGNDIDTDRIIPARFLRSIRFEGLEAHVFEDDRAGTPPGSPPHPFANPAYAGATLLLANANFGCGSSREHAPQALLRWGIRACIAESFSEIFRGNATALGMPCVTVSGEEVTQLMALVEADPAARLSLSVSSLTLQAGPRTYPVGVPPAVRMSLLEGTWDATGLLLDRFDQVEAVAARLPYVTGF